MATRGQKPKTVEQKKAIGETRPCRTAVAVVDFPKVDQVPAAPDWMAEEGQQLWGDLAPMLYAQKILTKADIPALTHLCALHAQNIRMLKAGLTPTAAENNALRSYLSEFGLTPSARTRVTPAGDSGKTNPFAKNGPKGKGTTA